MGDEDVCVQSTDPENCHKWVDRFRATLEEDDPILTHGQFVWAWLYAQVELDNYTDRVLDPTLDLDLRKKLKATPVSVGDETYLSYVEGLLKLANRRDSVNFEKLRAKALAETVKHSPFDDAAKPVRAEMIKLLTKPSSLGKTAYQRANAYMSAGRIVAGPLSRPEQKPPRQPTPEYAEIFAPKNLGFRGALKIHQVARSGCAELVRTIGQFVLKRQGPKCNPKLPRPPLNHQLCSPGQAAVHHDAPLYTLIKYLSNTEKAVGLTELAIHRGYTVRAQVIAGTDIGEGLPEVPPTTLQKPDHYILIFGYEPDAGRVRFVFWDPDCLVSTSFGKGFGLLYFVPADGSGHSGDHGNKKCKVHKYGRFTTASGGGADDDKQLAVDSAGKHVSFETHNKRYQVVGLDVL